jgi:Tfp pilus assembly protein PilX
VRRRRGFALAIALLAVVLIAALLAALFFAVNEETRTGSAIASRDDALAAAETAITNSLDQLRTGALDQSVGTVTTLGQSAGGLSSIVYVTRLDSTLFWLVAAVTSEGNTSEGTRRIGVLATASERQDDSIRIVHMTRRGWSELY